MHQMRRLIKLLENTTVPDIALQRATQSLGIVEAMDIHALRNRYSPYQANILIALQKSPTGGFGRSPWHLAGHWYFGEKIRGFGNLRPFPLDGTARPLVAKAWELSKANYADQTVRLQNKAAYLCSCLMWEALFPEDFPGKPITTLTAAAGFADVDQTNFADWVQQNLSNHSRLYGYIFDVKAKDCVRIAGGEG